MSITIVGSVAFDTLYTHEGNREKILGGSAVYAAIAARLFAPVSIVGVVGNDFSDNHLTLLRNKDIDISDNYQVFVDGSNLTINPATNLTLGHTYSVLIDSTAIRGGYGAYFAGISDTNTWRFTNAVTDTIPPALVSVDPQNNTTQAIVGTELHAMANEDLTIRLTEEVTLKAGGVITISNLTTSPWSGTACR